MLTSLPNLLTMARIGFIPVIVGLLFLGSAEGDWAGLCLYVCACVTDYFDGRLARKRGLTSPLGRFLDPVADKLLVAAILLMLVDRGVISGLALLAAMVILCREILVSGLREFLAELQVPMPVSRLAKWKTTVQMVAIGVLIVAEAGPEALMLPEVGIALLWLAALLTLVTGYDYLTRGLKHMLAD